MDGYQHGWDSCAADLLSGKDALDFSTGLNPLGMPVQIARALKVAVNEFDLYPDPHSRELAQALEAWEGAESGTVVVTAGATDALARIVETIAPHKALVCTPTFPDYEPSLRRVRARIVHHSLVAREDFDLTERFVDYIEPDIEAVFLSSPNNPTGRIVPRELLCKILRTADRWGTWVVVDESFLGFAAEHSAVSLLDRFPQLIVVKSFSKIFAMAGLRIGWCVCGSKDVARRLEKAGIPWAVSKPAQVAAKAALEVPGYLDLTCEYVASERERLESGLRELGMLVIPSHSNMILFQSSPALGDVVRERGLLMRSCEEFRGLDATWYSVAVRTSEDNKRLLEAIRQAIRQARENQGGVA